MSIRFKIILPYLLIMLVVAVTGVYVVTRLVADSLSERLTNQLLEAGRVVSDGMVRQENSHIESARIIAFTRGLADTVRDNDSPSLLNLAKPIAVGLGIENLIVINLAGRELLHLIKGQDGSLRENNQLSGGGFSAIAQTILESNDPESLPQRVLSSDILDGRYYYFTAIPISLDNKLVGVGVVGTSLHTLLPYLKSISLADVIIYANNGEAIATTLGVQNVDPEFLKTLSIPKERYEQVVNSQGTTSGENFTMDDRSYSLARGALRVDNDRLGAFAVVLPSNYVLLSGAASRDSYVLLFVLAMIAVILIGYMISRQIINPLNTLVETSQAVSRGDLTQRSGIHSKDEIGILANTFDEMTVNLSERSVELERTNMLLKQMDRTKSSFIEVSGHELRTPLTLIKAYTQMLEEKSSDNQEEAPLIKGILDSTERLNEIVNNMLDVSKIDSKTLKVMIEKNVQIQLLIINQQKIFQSALKERNLTLNVQELNSLPAIAADPDLLSKVFFHLIMNAIKYTPDGGAITISGRTIEDSPETPEVEIVVCDTGIGIAPEHHELIFEKFFQTGDVTLHSSGKTKFKGGGPGLGLAIVCGIVDAHAGRIWVESSGHNEQTYPGSEFHMRLPMYRNVEN